MIALHKFTNEDNEKIDLSDTIIVAGAVSLSKEPGKEQVRKVKKYLMHPDYDSSTHQMVICCMENV